MSEAQIKSLVTKFVSDLEAAFRQQALAMVQETLRAALGGGQVASAPVAAKRGPGRPKQAKRSPKKVASAPNGSGRVRRSTAQIEQAAHRVLDHVRRNPGQRSEDIRASLRMDKGEWVRTVSRLVEKGQLKSQGEKRNTTYSAA